MNDDEWCKHLLKGDGISYFLLRVTCVRKINIRADVLAYAHTHGHTRTITIPHQAQRGSEGRNLAGHLVCISAEVAVLTSSLVNKLLLSKGYQKSAQVSVTLGVNKDTKCWVNVVIVKYHDNTIGKRLGLFVQRRTQKQSLGLNIEMKVPFVLL